jgi:O-antigen/teichoic acid export membrane protein
MEPASEETAEHLIEMPSPPPLVGEPGDEYERRYATQSYGQLLRGLGSNISVYSIGVFATRFGSLLLVPLYWRVLEPRDYGILTGAGIVTAITGPILGFAIAESIMRFYHVWPVAERRERIGTVWVVDWLTSIIFGAALALFAGPLLAPFFRNIPFDPYLRFAILLGILNSFTASPFALLRVEGKDRQFVALSVCLFLLQTLFILTFVVYLKRAALGVLEGQALAAAAMIPVFTWIMLRSARPGVRKSYAREALTYSIPLVPGALIESFTPVTDRFVLEKYVSLAALGIYGLADSFAGIVRTFSIGIKAAWVPFQMRLSAEREDAKEMMARSADHLAVALFSVGLGLGSLGPDVIVLIGKPAYFPVAKYMVPLIIPYIFNGLQPVFAAGFAVARKTKYAWGIAFAHLAISLAAAFILVPRFGLYGAIAATTLGYGSRFLVGVIVSQRTYHVNFHWGKLAIVVAGVLAGYFAGTLLPAPPSVIGGVSRMLLLALVIPALFLIVTGPSTFMRILTARSASANRRK